MEFLHRAPTIQYKGTWDNYGVPCRLRWGCRNAWVANRLSLIILVSRQAHNYFSCLLIVNEWAVWTFTQNGYGNTRLSNYEPYWEKKRLKVSSPCWFTCSILFIQLRYIRKVKPPKVNIVDVFLDQKQYGKRLIGNAFSVPVAEILLR